MPNGWRSTDGTVSNVVEYHTKAGPLYSVVFTYKVDGSWYGGTFTTMAFQKDGDTLAVSYDPSNPEINNFLKRERTRRWLYIVFFTGMAMLAIYLFTHPNP